MPEHFLHALILATVAGLAIPAGAGAAMIGRLLPRWHEDEFRHGIVAFGAGALLSAVALVLIPEGIDRAHGGIALLSFALGGLTLMVVDRALARSGGKAAQFTAMMLDYLPEAMALGAMLADQGSTAVLLALMIALQNLPEGFNAYREMAGGSGEAGRWRLFALFCLMVPVGPLAALAGLLFLSGSPAVLGVIMMFSAGGIVYLLFQDLAPQVRLERHWGPPLGGVAGFLLGLAGHVVLH
ncbi:hypothetical protein K1T73_16755 [Roseovarius sp. SCSIO 43702]|uniref:ZIP family metal transporter n=1 Tax=Roseovarius sp. SCSIO 43702 TaxID=2823043 RepID=UPI001C72B90D|nr:hypothetical protein [Roseovarius sp. SCSIO 43702]QYX56662.1 hypothetical protein K1T73_16755 [Roseovarius sp. SCSIO 43702]